MFDDCCSLIRVVSPAPQFKERHEDREKQQEQKSISFKNTFPFAITLSSQTVSQLPTVSVN